MAVIERGRPLTVGRLPAAPLMRRLRFRYDRERDVFTITAPPPRPAVSHDLDGEIWIRFIPATGEIVGFEIEDFAASFLRRHPDLQRPWPLANGRFVPLFISAPARRRLAQQLYDHIRRTLARQPVQYPLRESGG